MTDTDDMPDELDVVAIGHALVDVMAETEDSLLDSLGLTKGTMALIDEARAHELYRAMGPAVEVSGGSAANTAAGVASLGGRAGFMGVVSDDLLGQVFTHDIRAAGVTYRTAPTSDGAATGRSLILVTPDAERTMNTFLGAGAEIGTGHVDEDLVRAGATLYLEGYLWDAPSARDAYRAAIDVARGAGRRVALSLSDPFCVDRHRAAFRDLAEHHVDILFGNEAEVRSLYGEKTLAGAVQRLQASCPLAAITRGAAGSMVVAAGAVIEIPAAPVDRVVDTTGAGDLYAAGFLYGVARGADHADCARLGGVAAAEIISHVGGRPQRSLRQLAGAAGLPVS